MIIPQPFYRQISYVLQGSNAAASLTSELTKKNDLLSLARSLIRSSEKYTVPETVTYPEQQENLEKPFPKTAFPKTYVN